MRRLRWIAPLLVVVVLAATVLVMHGCASTVPNRDPTGEVFPTVKGESLEEDEVTLPDAFAGEPVVLLVGYRQGTQFDIDRWILGLMQAGVTARIVEVPTIPGLVTSLASGWIDDGMRSGIPREDWGAVVTLYGGAADPVAEFTGTESGRNARVLVLDQGGRVAWFTDRGYSASQAIEVASLLEKLQSGEPVSGLGG